MKRYIDADKLMTWFDDHYDFEEFSVGYISGIIREQPTAPVREVVLCRDCKNYEPGEPPVGWCHAWSGATLEDAFCSFAERIEEANESGI